MKNSHKKFAAILACLASATIAISVILLSNNNLSMLFSYNEPYGIVFNSSVNKFFSGTGSTDYSGQSTIKTKNGNDIDFEYYTIAGGSSSAWHLVKNGGYFYNLDPIHGLESLTISCTAADKEFRISWGSDFTFGLGSCLYQSSVEGITCEFNYDSPTYFKFENISGSNISIKSMSVFLNCINYYPSVNLGSNYDDGGIVSGGGIKKTGDSVTITAVPNNGFIFIGWYDKGNLVSSNASYTFNMGNDDISYIAHFTYDSFNFVVESESLEKGVVSDSSGCYDYLSQVTIEATAKNGYSFDGWYKGSSKISSDNPYVFSMPSEDITYIAKFSTNSYDLTLVNNNSDLGTISGGGDFLYGSNVTITATPNTGAAFIGWFDSNDRLVSDLKSYSFVMPYSNLEYTAKFEWVPYSVALTVNDNSMGNVFGSGNYHCGQSVTLTATPNEHHSFFGWYNGETLLSQNTSYSFEMPNTSLEYEARFVKNYNLIVYSDNEEMGTVSAPIECGAGLEVTLTATPNDGYALDYWCDENYDELSLDNDFTFVMPAHDIEIIAVFTTMVTLKLDSNYSDQVVTVFGGGVYSPRSCVTICAQAIDGFVFDGWYDINYVLFSNSIQCSFSITNDMELFAYYRQLSVEFLFDNIDESLKTCSLIGYNGSLPNNLYVPKFFENNTVTSIEGGAFNDCSSVLSVFIPDSIDSIGNHAFQRCSYLESVTLPFVGGSASSNQYLGYIFGASNYYDNSKYVPSSLKNIILSNKCTSIANSAFQNCSSIKSVIIPDSVTSIGSSAFRNCSGLKSLTLPFVGGSASSNQYLGYIFGATSYSDNTKYISSFLNLIILSNKCTSIAPYAFYNCSNRSFVIPSSINSIKSYAFYQCNNCLIYYAGTSEEWFDISVGLSGNEPLKGKKYYYLESDPGISDQYWHYVDGVPAIW